jgi:hypothetical protein
MDIAKTITPSLKPEDERVLRLDRRSLQTSQPVVRFHEPKPGLEA